MELICPILDRPTTVDKTAFARDSWFLVRCRETGLVFLANPPEYSELETTFAWEGTWAAERIRRQSAEPFVSRISSFAKFVKVRLFPNRNRIASITANIVRKKGSWTSTRILDVGCGTGDLMLALHEQLSTGEQRVVLHGIEVSKKLAMLSAKRVKRIGGAVTVANALDGVSMLEPKSVHVAVMCSFLEHEARPLQLLRRTRKALTPDGVVVVKVPNFASWNRVFRGTKWCGLRYPDHVNYFTPKTLQRMATEAGFMMSRQRLRDRFPMSDNMYAILTKKN